MHLILNGNTEECACTTLAELIDHKGLHKEALIVELNGAIIKQEQWPATTLQDGDQLELLNFVGGG
ncbi:MAG: sulfur carrier protein ThiS [Desulfobulbaceae bacterium]|nr:sulfur carrier protein ThiS [Desulfobulbaceae bacterium]